MKKYYCVATTIKDNGVVSMNIVSTTIADKKPENSYKSTPRADLYLDWFDSEDEAQNFIEA